MKWVRGGGVSVSRLRRTARDGDERPRCACWVAGTDWGGGARFLFSFSVGSAVRALRSELAPASCPIRARVGAPWSARRCGHVTAPADATSRVRPTGSASAVAGRARRRCRPGRRWRRYPGNRRIPRRLRSRHSPDRFGPFLPQTPASSLPHRWGGRVGRKVRELN